MKLGQLGIFNEKYKTHSFDIFAFGALVVVACKGRKYITRMRKIPNLDFVDGMMLPLTNRSASLSHKTRRTHLICSREASECSSAWRGNIKRVINEGETRC